MNGRLSRTWAITHRAARRLAIAVIGATVVTLGIAMLVLPGPGLLTIVAGLAILGLEFAFARRWLARMRKTARTAAEKAADRVGRGRAPQPPSAKT